MTHLRFINQQHTAVCARLGLTNQPGFTIRDTMKAYGKVTGNLYECAVWTDIPKVGNGWTVGDVIDVIYSLDGGSDHPGPWIVRRVWYEAGAWRMEAERKASSGVRVTEWRRWDDNFYATTKEINICSRCGQRRPVIWTPDPFDLEVNPEDDPQPDWWCEECWHARHDDV